MLTDEFKIKLLNKIGKSIIEADLPKLDSETYVVNLSVRQQVCLNIDKENYDIEIKKKYFLDESVDFKLHQEKYFDLHNLVFLFLQDLIFFLTTEKESFNSDFLSFVNEKNKILTKDNIYYFFAKYFFYLVKFVYRNKKINFRSIDMFVHNNFKMKITLESQIVYSYIILLSKKIVNYYINNKKPNLTNFLNDLLSI